MTNDDVLGLHEDILKSRLVYQATADRLETRQLNGEAAQIRAAALTIRNQTETIKKLKEELANVTEKNNETVIVANTAALTLGDAIEELARVTNVPVEEVRRKFNNEIRSIRYDQAVTEALRAGNLRADPRGTDRVRSRKWYVPGLTD
jgi:translation initiation factor 2B subunit (eIF-2B alpha/beta/delta family)